MKATKQRISVNNVYEINKKVIDVAFRNGCNAALSVVIPRNLHKKSWQEMEHGWSERLGRMKKLKNRKW